MFPIVASDLDGTLLSPESVFTPYAAETLKKITNKGIRFIFATGRHHIDIFQKKASLDLDAYMVTSNGAIIHDPQGNIIFEQSIPTDIVKELALFAKDDPYIYTHIYQGDQWLINKEDKSSLEYFKDVVFSYDYFDMNDFNHHNIYKTYFTTVHDSERDHLVRLKERIEERFGDQISITFSALNCLDIMAKGVCKGNALAFIVDKLGHTLNDVIAFGDSMNDREMLSMVGKGCLMSNANPDLKACLPNLETIGTNAEEAVPHYLANLYLK